MPLSQTINFDATAVKSQALRRLVERTLEALSLNKAEGVWDSLRKGQSEYPDKPTVLVGDLCELTSAQGWKHWTVRPSLLFVVFLVRTASDETRLSSPDVVFCSNEGRFFVCDVKCSAATESSSLHVLHDYFKAFVERLEPDRILAAKVVDGIIWVQFGDGLERAVEWRELPFAKRLGVVPTAAWAREHGDSVSVRDASGREAGIDAGVLRAAMDADFQKHMAAEDEADRRAVGAKIRRLRERLNLSQEEVSRKGGLPQESLSRIENGRRDPRLDTLRKLAKGFGVTLPVLLERLSSDQANGRT